MTAPALPQTVPPLVARLGSDADGERLACLRQLDRVLERAGLSWTELARRLDGPVAKREPQPKPRTERHHREPPDWREMINFIVAHPNWRPSAKEENFVFSMARLVTRRRPTPKQTIWLNDIIDRLRGVAMMDVSAFMEPVARELLGEPNRALSGPKEWRYGSRGSLSIDLEKGVWHDHERGEGGGVSGSFAARTWTGQRRGFRLAAGARLRLA